MSQSLQFIIYRQVKIMFDNITICCSITLNNKQIVNDEHATNKSTTSN